MPSLRLYNIDKPNYSPELFVQSRRHFQHLRSDYELMCALFRPVPSTQKHRVSTKPFIASELESDYTTKRYRERSPINDMHVGLLGRFLPELIDHIFLSLDTLQEVLFFAVTCQRYYAFARRHIERRVEEMFVISCSGDRLIFLDDNVKLDKMHPAPLSCEDVTLLTDRQTMEKNRTRYDYCYSMYRSPRVFEDSSQAITNGTLKDPKPPSLSAYIFNICNMLQTPEDAVLHRDVSIVLNDLVTIANPVRLDLYKKDAYILRNLSTREYIRGKPVGIKCITFEQVLYAKIMWSEDAFSSGDGPMKGPWATHRFDLVESGFEDMEQDEWTDVSDEAIQYTLKVLDYDAWVPA